MRRLSRWHHVAQLTFSCEVSLNTAAVGLVCMGVSRSVSTAPPLSLLSWSVDGAGHTYHRCRRRLSVQERIPLICSTIREAAPDIVALQDSLPEVAEALCRPSTPNNNKLYDAVAESDLQYKPIGSVRNGRCGYLQLFRRCDSVWDGRLLPSCPCLTAEFVAAEPNKNTSAAVGGRGGGVRFVLTNLDLSYRGKSLAVGGKSLAPADVSAGGSPFTLRVSPGTPARQRVKGQLDPHREAALAFVSQVSRPDVLLGNFFMGREETMPGYNDAWVLAGAPAEHERTTNTFAHHKHDTETNYYYFVAHRRGGECNVINNQAVFPAADAPVGTPIPLNSCRLNDVAESTANSSLKKKNNNISSSSSDTGPQHGEVPQVAGRFQRCFLRCLPSRNHKRQLPFFCRYERRQLMVLKPFTDVALTTEEMEKEETLKSQNGDTSSVRCSASDSYPILVLLS